LAHWQTAGGKAAVAELARELSSQPISSSDPPQTLSDAAATAVADWTWRPSANMRKAVELLHSLAPHDLTMILFNFLVATMAKDLSIMFSVAARPMSHPSVAAPCQLPRRATATDIGDVEVECLSACTRQSSCGIFSIASRSAGESRAPLDLFSVRAAFVDLDCKPVAKLPAYERMDRDIVLHFLQQMGLQCTK
jgi:hypothetical protein